ncbi:MAG: hypothetical protein JSR67_16330 [Proteobacteria bacterium]|nr:hypothetical protein [Pseudomonadota bacterium]
MPFLPNHRFLPDADARGAPPFHGRLHIARTPMQVEPALAEPVVLGRDARLFPAITLDFVTDRDLLIPLQRATAVSESEPGALPSYWQVIPQFGRVWCDPRDAGWYRAAFPLMLVNDTENEAHQGLATFLYRDGSATPLHFQFVQQTAPYLLKQHFIACGSAAVRVTALAGDIGGLQRVARGELERRLPCRPWRGLARVVPPGTLDGFGAGLEAHWVVISALVRDGVLYYQESPTPCGNFPYPLEMRFGVRSVMKSVGVPLALLRLAQTFGPAVRELKVGDYVAGLHPKYRHIRFLDAANMATGFGGVGSLNTEPNDIEDGHLGGDYDAWYTGPSHADKLRQIQQSLKPYPWEPGSVVRYRDQDFYLLGAALDGLVKELRGPGGDVWDMLEMEVFQPLGIARMPAVRTRELGARGLTWFNAGLYPTVEELARIALLYQNHGAWQGTQLLHRRLTEDLLSGRGALPKTRAVVAGDTSSDQRGECGLYGMGFHYVPHLRPGADAPRWLPTMRGSGQNEVVLFPGHLVSIRIGKAADLPDAQAHGIAASTLAALERLAAL